MISAFRSMLVPLNELLIHWALPSLSHTTSFQGCFPHICSITLFPLTDESTQQSSPLGAQPHAVPIPS